MWDRPGGWHTIDHGWWPGLIHELVPLLFLAVLVLLAVWAVRRITDERRLVAVAPSRPGSDGAVQELRLRYARGELDRDEFVQRVRVLVVDDESNITDLVATALRYEGFDVSTAGDGRTALSLVESFRPHAIVLDVMLPDVDGFEVQRKLSERGQRAPVVFLTARDATEDKVHGLTIGGDDYVTKPFSLEELIARIRTVLRRASRTASAGQARLRFEDLEMDDDTHEVWRGHRQIELTPTEFSLLRLLLSNPRRVLSKGQILDHVWQYDFGGDASIVETYISYLRKKIDVEEPHLLHTVRGVGYVLRLPRS